MAPNGDDRNDGRANKPVDAIEPLNNSELNALNKEILMQLHEKGIAAPSYTVLNGNYAIRAAITNHRTRKEDLEMMVNGVIEIGKSLI